MLGKAVVFVWFHLHFKMSCQSPPPPPHSYKILFLPTVGESAFPPPQPLTNQNSVASPTFIVADLRAERGISCGSTLHFSGPGFRLNCFFMCFGGWRFLFCNMPGRILSPFGELDNGLTSAHPNSSCS